MLRVGSASVDITPDRGVSLLGYDFRQEHLPPGNEGVLDRLYARALVLDAGDGPAVIVTCDLCVISVALARHLRGVVAQAVGCEPDRVLIGCSHTHSGPWLQEPAMADDLGAVLPHTGDWPEDHPGQAYTKCLAEWVRQVAVRAVGYQVPATVQVREAPLGLGYTRRVRQADGGLAQCWGPDEFPNLAPSGQADPTLSTVILRQRNGSRQWLLWSHGTHPVVLGKTSTLVSADWPGATIRDIERRLPNSEGHFLLGPCGDVHPWIATQDRAQAVDDVGQVAGAHLALLARSGGHPEDHPQLSIVTRSLVLGGRDVDLAAWRIGPMTIAASPTELFADLALALRCRVAGPLMVATNTNGWTGYWPNREAFDEGGYEIEAARAMGRQPGDGERLVEELAMLVDQAQ